MAEKKIFRADFSYISGEAEMIFHRTVVAGNVHEAERKIRRWLLNHGPQAEQLGRMSYMYAYGDGCYCIKYHGMSPTSGEELVRYLLI